MPIDEIRNFLPVNDRVGTGGQPSEAQVREVVDTGYEVVINLGLLGQTYSLPDEAGLVRSLGLDYRHIPVDFKAPNIEDFEQFSQAMDEAEDKRVFVHCAANYRVSCFVGLYGQRRWGWTVDQADAHIANISDPDEVWSAFLADVRRRL